MIEMAALLVLIERCAPQAPVQSIVSVVRQASGFEPLILGTIQSGRPLTVQAMSKDEAIGLATEMKVAGQRVQLGLAGVDAREFERRDVPLTEAFEACTNLRIAAQVLAKQPFTSAARPPVPAPRSVPRKAPPVFDVADGPDTDGIAATPAGEPSGPARPSTQVWDVYGSGRTSAALVYGEAAGR